MGFKVGTLVEGTELAKDLDVGCIAHCIRGRVTTREVYERRAKDNECEEGDLFSGDWDVTYVDVCSGITPWVTETDKLKAV